MKTIVIVAAALIGMVSFSGCNDFLDKIPDNRTELDSKEKIAELLVNAYPKEGYVSFTEIMTDNVGDKGPDAYKTSLVNTDPYYWKDFSNDGIDTPSHYWDACYNAIAHANMALEAIESSPFKATMDAEKGEALACRAYAHFMLVTLFAKTYDKATAGTDLGIPYVTEVEKVVTKEYNRGTVAAVYDKVELDLLEALSLISDEGYKIPKYHFTKMATYAFASRFYLFKQDYANVRSYSSIVLGSDPSAKFRNWEQYAATTPINLQRTYTMATESSNLLLQESLSVWGRFMDVYRYGLTSEKNKAYFIDANISGGKWLYTTYSGGELNISIPKFQEFFKKISVDASTGLPYIMAPLFTVEEVFFNQLEAKIMEDAPSADVLRDINLFLSKRIKNYNPLLNGLTMAKITAYYGKGTARENLLACVLGIKKLEFLHEGLRWFDILRHKIEVVHTTFERETLTLKGDDLRRVLQIPSKAINCGIPKNPR